jgi:hypothetical protein
MKNMALLSLAESADYLSMSPRNLHRIVSRSRSQASRGQNPEIRFFQYLRGRIKFRQEWLDDFIDRHSTPVIAIPPPPRQRRTSRAKPQTVVVNRHW